MTETKPMTIDNSISSVRLRLAIKLRLKILDREIFDAKKRLKEAESLGGHSCYGAGYAGGVLATLYIEKVNLEHTLKGIYDGE